MRLGFPQKKPEESRFAGAVGPDYSDPVAAHNGGRKIFDDRPVPVGKRCTGHLADNFTAHPGILNVHSRHSRALPALAPLSAHLFQHPHAALVARAPRLDPLPDPAFLLRKLFVKGLPLVFSGRQLRCLEIQIIIIIARPTRKPPAVKLHDAGCQPPQKHAVVGDKKDTSFKTRKEFLHPAD